MRPPSPPVRAKASALHSYTTMFSKQFIALVSFVISTLAAPSPRTPIRRADSSIPPRHIVILEDGTNFSDIFDKLTLDSTVTHSWDIVNGFAGNFPSDDIELLTSHPNVTSIEQDGDIYVQTVTTQ